VFVARTDEDDLQWIERYANRRLQIED
jgi:hypothetical protein